MSAPHRLTRYWYEFDIRASTDARMMPWVGVTAWTREDAEELMRSKLFGDTQLPPITRLVEDVKVTDLDENHVQRHMEPPHVRGIWYPRGFAHE